MTIAQAFCLDREFRVNAAFGIWNSKLSFYCCSPRCGLQVFPRLSKAGTPHFVSKAKRLGVHVPECPHVVGLSKATRSPSHSSRGGSSLPLPTLRYVPDTMVNESGGRGEPMTRRYSREEIAELAARAPTVNFPGDLEDCTDAYRSMDTEQRNRHPLLIDGRLETYGVHYGTRAQAQAAQAGIGPERSVVVFQGRGEAANEFGAISIVSAAEPFPISLHIPAAYLATKRYLREIWSDLYHSGSETVTVYWRGPGPDQNGDLPLSGSNHDGQFAIRCDGEQ